jgi:hypothetical protein
MSENVERFTTEYHASEDRIRLSIAFNDGSVQLLWLTRRLLDRLIERLLAEIGSSSLPGGTARSPSMANVQQRFNQHAATTAMKPQKPVRVDTSTQNDRPAALVTSIDLRGRRRVLILDFRSEEAVLATIPFAKEALRQWLAVLHKRYEDAGWPGDLWPDWIKGTTGDHMISSARLN